MTTDDRLARVEQHNRRLTWGLGICGALVCVVLVRGSSGRPESQAPAPAVANGASLRLRRLEIVDKNDQAVVVLAAGDRPASQGGGGHVFVLGQHGAVLLTASGDGANIRAMIPGRDDRQISLEARLDESKCLLLHDGTTIELVAAPNTMVRARRDDRFTMMGFTPKTTMFGAQQEGAAIMAGIADGLPTLTGSDATGNVLFVQPTP